MSSLAHNICWLGVCAMWSTEAGVVLTILASPRTGRRLAKPRHTTSPDTVTTTRSAEAVHQPAARPVTAAFVN